MQKALTRLYLSKLAPQEVSAYRQGLAAVQDFADKHNVHVWIEDVKHKRSGPVISCWIEGHSELDDVIEQIFEEAMERSES